MSCRPDAVPPFVDLAWVRQHREVVLADVRWYADDRDPAAAYAAGHLPGAVRVDLDRGLAAPPTPEDGRHPLPDPGVFAEGMGKAGIGESDTVVAYDDAGGVVAARLVWMLRALGLQAALLDGGLAAWDGPLSVDEETRPGAGFAPRPWPAELLADIEEVAALSRPTTLGGPPAVGPGQRPVLLDARSSARYAGQPDALDPKAGHIPGARSFPCQDNLDESGRLLAAEILRSRLASVGVAEGGPATISSCGSGVTACHTLLVLDHLGLPGRLYPGSWSQWSRSDRPAATGPAPWGS